MAAVPPSLRNRMQTKQDVEIRYAITDTTFYVTDGRYATKIPLADLAPTVAAECEIANFIWIDPKHIEDLFASASRDAKYEITIPSTFWLENIHLCRSRSRNGNLLFFQHDSITGITGACRITKTITGTICHAVGALDPAFTEPLTVIDVAVVQRAMKMRAWPKQPVCCVGSTPLRPVLLKTADGPLSLIMPLRYEPILPAERWLWQEAMKGPVVVPQPTEPLPWRREDAVQWYDRWAIRFTNKGETLEYCDNIIPYRGDAKTYVTRIIALQKRVPAFVVNYILDEPALWEGTA